MATANRTDRKPGAKPMITIETTIEFIPMEWIDRIAWFGGEACSFPLVMKIQGPANRAE